MQKQIILHITPSLMIGGAEKLLIDLLTNFQTNPANCFEHQVAYFQTGPHLATLQALGIKTYDVSGLIKYYDLICFYKLLRLIKKIKPYALHAMLWSANLYATIIGKLLRIPIICAIHSNHNSGNYNQDNFIKLKIDQLILRWATKIIVVSPEILIKYSSPTYGLGSRQLVLITNGVKIPSKFASLTLRPAQDERSSLAKIAESAHDNPEPVHDKPKRKVHPWRAKASKPFTIGNVGRLVPVKNQALLIKALALVKKEISNLKAIIIGSGPLEQSLKDLSFELNLQNQITFIQTNQPEKYYAQFDCFVLPSDQEGQSIALLEAMSWQVTPIVVHKNNLHDIVINLKNGLICRPNHPKKLAQKMIFLYHNQEINSLLGKTARLRVKDNFNLLTTANNYLNLYFDKAINK